MSVDLDTTVAASQAAPSTLLERGSLPQGSVDAQRRELHALISDDTISLDDVADLDDELASILLTQLRSDSVGA